MKIYTYTYYLPSVVDISVSRHISERNHQEEVLPPLRIATTRRRNYSTIYYSWQDLLQTSVVDIPVSRHLSERNHQEEVLPHPRSATMRRRYGTILQNR